MISLQSNRNPTRGCFGLLAFTAAAAFADPTPDAIWKRHTIDNSSRGADGARLADVNGDGLLDIATGWEAGGIVRAYLNPGPAQSKQKWPAVTVGEVAEVEDAVFVDLDGDGAVDVVSSCESGISTMFVHWAPRDNSRYLDPGAWRTAPLPVTEKKTKWMFCEPMQVDGRHGVDLIAGSKGPRSGGEAMLGWLQAPAHPRDLAAWTWHPLRTAGWIMGIQSSDMDGDGDLDIVFTDRFNGRKSGCHWLENPGKAHVVDGAWKEHVIGVAGGNALFFCLTDLDGDGLEDVCVGTHGADEGGPETDLFFLRRLDRSGTRWAERRIPLPPESAQFKAVSAGDVDLDGKLDLVVTFARAKDKPALIWLSHDGSPFAGRWTAHPLSGVDGKKLDLVTLLDLDGDGDLDALTTEEGFNLGVIWYENPTKQP